MCFGINGPLNVKLKYIVNLTLSIIGLGTALMNKQLMTAASINQLIENHKAALLNDFDEISVMDK